MESDVRWFKKCCFYKLVRRWRERKLISINLMELKRVPLRKITDEWFLCFHLTDKLSQLKYHVAFVTLVSAYLLMISCQNKTEQRHAKTQVFVLAFIQKKHTKFFIFRSFNVFVICIGTNTCELLKFSR